MPTLPLEDRIESLRKEHRAIVRQLGGVQRSLDRKKQRPQGRRELIDALGEKLKVHFIREEEMIYRPLNSVLKGHSPTEELMEDHRSIRRVFARLRGMGESLGDGQASMTDLRDQFQLLQSAIRTHLDKEEKVVFWLADYHL